MSTEPKVLPVTGESLSPREVEKQKFIEHLIEANSSETDAVVAALWHHADLPALQRLVDEICCRADANTCRMAYLDERVEWIWKLLERNGIRQEDAQHEEVEDTLEEFIAGLKATIADLQQTLDRRDQNLKDLLDANTRISQIETELDQAKRALAIQEKVIAKIEDPLECEGPPDDPQGTFEVIEQAADIGRRGDWDWAIHTIAATLQAHPKIVLSISRVEEER